MLPGNREIDAARLARLAPFVGVDDSTLSTIAGGGRAIRVGRRQRVVGRGDEMDGFYVVCEGRLKVYILSCDGSERTLRILDPGDHVGVATMFAGLPSPVYVEALAESRLAYIPRKLAALVLRNDHAFTETLFTGISRLVHDLVYDIESSCLMNARQRTAAYLLRLADAERPSCLTIDLPASKWVVASLLNLTPETFSRELHRLQDDGFIEIVRRTIHIHDDAGLRAILDGRHGAQRAG